MNHLAIELRNVNKSYGSFRAVDDLSLEVPTGSIYGFLGPNGAGKTTSIRMILDIIRPDAGTISILGQSSAFAVRNRIGYLPEEKGLYKKMKAWAVIAYFGTLKGLTRAESKKRALTLLDRYGLRDFSYKPTEALSKGMGQKVQILAALVHDPELVILDEPFSGLDPVNQQVMEEIVHDMAARGRTVVFSTHVMQHAERLCQRLVLIARGRKIFDGTVAQAKAKLPRRVLLETTDDIAPLRSLASVESIQASGESNGAKGVAGAWEVRLRDQAEAQAILEACFANRIQLRRFDQTEPSLHDVFVQLVGPEAREATYR